MELLPLCTRSSRCRMKLCSKGCIANGCCNIRRGIATARFATRDKRRVRAREATATSSQWRHNTQRLLLLLRVQCEWLVRRRAHRDITM